MRSLPRRINSGQDLTRSVVVGLKPQYFPKMSGRLTCPAWDAEQRHGDIEVDFGIARH